MQVYIHTFGCKVNSFESAAMAATLTESGFSIAQTAEIADVILVNSCTVTANGDRKVRQYLRQVKRNYPNCILVLTGCLPQAYPDVAAAFPEVDILTGTGNRQDIATLIHSFIQSHSKTVSILDNTKKTFELLQTDRIAGHTRAFLKIEDGCDRYCTYCIVPFARGNVRSMPLDTLHAQAALLAAHGYREIVLSGVNLSFYGRDIGCTLLDAVQTVAAIPEIVRVRLGSLEPDLLTEPLLTQLASVEKLCPHFHFALQSGCNETLRRMARHYDTSHVTAVANQIRALFDRPTFTADVMVGFPGETDADFIASLDYIKKFGFLKVHVFPYSVRPRTAAATFPGQVDHMTKTQRAADMTAAAEESRSAVLQSFVGVQARVILEQMVDSDMFSGYTDRYLPARVVGEGLFSGEIVCGQIQYAKQGYVWFCRT